MFKRGGHYRPIADIQQLFMMLRSQPEFRTFAAITCLMHSGFSLFATERELPLPAKGEQANPSSSATRSRDWCKGNCLARA